MRRFALQHLVSAFGILKGVSSRTKRITPRVLLVYLCALVWSEEAGAASVNTARAQPWGADVSDASPSEPSPSPSDPSQSEPRPQESAAAPLDDEAIQKRLSEIFSNVEGLRDVKLSVHAGVVTLRGESPSERLTEKAEGLAQTTSGVVFVENRIRPSPGVSERVRPTWERLKEQGADFVRNLPVFGIAALILLLFSLLARLIRKVEAPFRFIESRLLRDIVQRLLGTVVVVAGILVALELLEITALVGAVFGAAGVAGIILGFAFREIIENYLASILLSLRRPFSTGDHVVVATHEGKVIRLTSRDTILMTLEGNHLRLPNSVVFKAVILNYSRNPLRRFDFSAGLGVDEDISSAIALGRDTLLATPGVIPDPPPFARVEELGDSNVALRFFCWVDQRSADWFKVRSEAIRRTKVALDAAGIELPVPTYRISMKQEAEAGQSQPPLAPEALQHSAHEVTVDDHIERQMAHDRAREGDEENLL